MNTNRDPQDPSAAGAAVQAWLDAPESYEADDALLTILLDQGVISPADDIYAEQQAREHGVVHLFIHGGAILQVSTTGQVEQFA